MVNFKTNWSSSDFLTHTEYNRIKQNIIDVHSLAKTIKSVPNLPTQYDLTLESLGMIQYFNALERSLDVIANQTVKPTTFPATKTWYGNQKGFNYVELNRIEYSVEMLYNLIKGEITGIKTLEFTLGGDDFGA